MKTFILIFLLTALIPTILFSEKKWVQKHYVEYEWCKTFQYLDSNNVFAFVDDGGGKTKIYKSTDQGNIWFTLFEKDHLLVGDSLWEVGRSYVLDSLYLYIAYRDRIILDISDNGGKSFIRKTFGNLSLNHNKAIHNISMYNRNIGAIYIYDNLIITNDNWETYKIIPRSKYPKAGDPMFFIDSNNIALIEWRAGNDKFIKYNIEKDEWGPYSEDEDTVQEEHNKEIWDVFFVNDSLGYACGGQATGLGDTSKDFIWKTTDKGIHWKIILGQEHEPIFGLSNISFTNDMRGLAVGGWGKIVETSDGGETWTYLEVPEEVQNTISMRVTWAGSSPLIFSQKAGIHRYEETTGVSETILESDNIKIRQAADKLLISIEDKAFRKYKLQIFDLFGNLKKEEELGSGVGVLFMPVYLNNFPNGAYFYRISISGGTTLTGKFVIAE